MSATNWRFQNLTRGAPQIAIQSVDHAIELFMDASGENEYGVCLEFSGSPRGAINTIAGPGFGTLAFDPTYVPESHTLGGFQRAIPTEPKCNEPFYFDDGTCASSIPSQSLLGVVQIVDALRYIFEYNDFPPFLEWRPGS